MQRGKYVSSFCVLLFLIIEDANVNALDLTSCDNPLENEVCNLTCTTTDHLQNVAFNKQPDTSIIAQCAPGFGCFGPSLFSISQPDSVTTVLSFIHSRNYTGTWRCSYGSTPTPVTVPWATYPLTVTTTLTSNTTVDTNIDGNITLGCLYSEQAPNVTLQYKDINGNNDAMSAETFQCNATDSPCTDVDFTTYECPVVVKEETGIDNSHTYSIKVKIKVSHVQTEDIHTIVTDITFKPPSTTPGSGGTNTSTDNCDYKAIGILTGCLVIAFIIVIVMYAACRCCGCTCKTCGDCCSEFCEDCCSQFCEDCCSQFFENFCSKFFAEQSFTSSGRESSQTEQSFTSPGRESSQEGEGGPGFFKEKVLTLKSLCIFGCLVFYGVIVEVIVLPAVYYGYSKFQEELVIGVGFGIVLLLSGICLVVVWMLMKFVNNEKSKCEGKPENSTIMMKEKVTT